MKKLGFLIVAMTGLTVLLANATQLSAFLEDHPGLWRPWRRTAAAAPADPPRPAAAGRPARLVLIVENLGGVAEMRRLDLLIDPLTKRLLPEDTLSVIAFTEAGGRTIMERVPGGGFDGRCAARLHDLIPVKASERHSMTQAYDKAKDLLTRGADPARASAIMALSPETTGETLDAWFDRVRTDTSQTVLKFGTRAGEGNRRL